MTMWTRPGRFWICVGLPLMISLGACRETEPRPAHDRDLAEGGDPLLAVGSSWSDRAIATGSAEWVPFREPEIGGEPEPEAGTGESGASDEEGNAEIEEEIRTALEDYNEAAEEGEAEVLADFFVEEQVEPLLPWLEAAFELTDKLSQLREALAAGIPDQEDRVKQACDALEATHSVGLSATDIRVASETEAAGTLTWFGQPRSCRFVAIEDEDGNWAWFFELDGLQALNDAGTSFDALSTTYSEMLQALESEQTPAIEILERIERLSAPAGNRNADAEPPEDAGPEAGVEEP
jgi:hypothetical protein